MFVLRRDRSFIYFFIFYFPLCVVGYCKFASMGDLPSQNNGENGDKAKAIVPKPEILDFELPADRACASSMHVGALQESNSQSSDSLDTLFGDKDANSPPEISTMVQPKEEPNVMDEGLHIEKRASLLMMNFSVNEVDFALDKLGKDAPVYELVDFITAAQISENFEKETDDAPHDNDGTNEDKSDETLYGTMEITLQLLEMGFSENQVSLAIEKFGSKTPISELADKIFSGQIFLDTPRSRSYDTVKVKTEYCSPDVVSQSRKMNTSETSRGKRPKEEYFDDFSNSTSQFQHVDFQENRKGKRPKQESLDDSSSFLYSSWEEKVKPNSSRYGMQQAFNSNPCRSINKVVAQPPYFFYGNVVDVSIDCWVKMSHFLYSLEPEFVNSQYFSALSRREGYLHNLPTTNRFHIPPEPPMTIQDAIPHTKKWWPSWDTRKHLSCINSGTGGISQLCERFEKLLRDSRGVLSSQQQRDILHRSEKLNLVWVGAYKLGPVDPEHIELILGYPSNHTQAAGNSLTARLESLRHCFQTDTLGYHLSVLKSMFPGGLTMLSVFSGIGGAEVTLHRLGIKLKGVISIETSETNRRILKRWWESSGQTGELVQIEDIQALTTKKFESLIHKLGSIDFVICQNSVPQIPNSKQISNSKDPKMAAESDNLPDFDFSLYYEFVRVVQRVRSMKR
ncbi:probable inactive DNA (cytosine-5)-methyltransferase DRM3 isoform X2 [Citrus clementina]|uniref:probable inactive DNA (cytosine-5)-methyltransferase DRM3 isoform X2 n=1 Tax=Citrus clementina TaxID=85681 RepID=UPI000CED4FC8|nr:probable inactive DNA (cytosine-5)-methyltransferase DRM3 isoform X2 [Citrus x clementina]